MFYKVMNIVYNFLKIKGRAINNKLRKLNLYQKQ